MNPVTLLGICIIWFIVGFNSHGLLDQWIEGRRRKRKLEELEIWLEMQRNKAQKEDVK